MKYRIHQSSLFIFPFVPRKLYENIKVIPEKLKTQHLGLKQLCIFNLFILLALSGCGRAKLYAEYQYFNNMDSAVEASDIIIFGEVTDVKKHQRIEVDHSNGTTFRYEVAEVSVKEVIYGTAEVGGTIMVKQLEREQTTIKAGYLKAGQKCILFLDSYDDVPSSLINPSQGKMVFDDQLLLINMNEDMKELLLNHENEITDAPVNGSEADDIDQKAEAAYSEDIRKEKAGNSLTGENEETAETAETAGTATAENAETSETSENKETSETTGTAENAETAEREGIAENAVNAEKSGTEDYDYNCILEIIHQSIGDEN